MYENDYSYLCPSSNGYPCVDSSAWPEVEVDDMSEVFGRLVNMLISMTSKGILNWRCASPDGVCRVVLAGDYTIRISHEFGEYSVLEIVDDWGITVGRWTGDGTIDDAIKLVYDHALEYYLAHVAELNAKAADDVLQILLGMQFGEIGYGRN